MIKALDREAVKRKRPPTSLDELLGHLAKTVPIFAADVREFLATCSPTEPWIRNLRLTGIVVGSASLP